MDYLAVTEEYRYVWFLKNSWIFFPPFGSSLYFFFLTSRVGSNERVFSSFHRDNTIPSVPSISHSHYSYRWSYHPLMDSAELENSGSTNSTLNRNIYRFLSLCYPSPRSRMSGNVYALLIDRNRYYLCLTQFSKLSGYMESSAMNVF